MKMYDMASRMAGHLAREVEMEQSRVDVVRFGLEIMLGEIIKWGIMLMVASLLGILSGVLFAMVSTAVFRLVSGGNHCEDYWRCLVFGLIVFMGVGKLGLYAQTYLSPAVLVKLIVACYLIVTVMVFAWVPGEVPNRRIKPGERVLFKKLAAAYMAVWTGVAIMIFLPNSISVTVAGMLGIIVQAMSFTPMGYRLIDRFDIALSKIIGERRCPAHAESA